MLNENAGAEIWAQFCPDYEINTRGHVRHKKHKKRLATRYVRGYERLRIVERGINKFVHRLIMEIFLPIENMGAMQVNHKDGNTKKIMTYRT